jgi:hypothetical protein
MKNPAEPLQVPHRIGIPGESNPRKPILLTLTTGHLAG